MCSGFALPKVRAESRTIQGGLARVVLPRPSERRKRGDLAAAPPRLGEPAGQAERRPVPDIGSRECSHDFSTGKLTRISLLAYAGSSRPWPLPPAACWPGLR